MGYAARFLALVGHYPNANARDKATSLARGGGPRKPVALLRKRHGEWQISAGTETATHHRVNSGSGPESRHEQKQPAPKPLTVRRVRRIGQETTG